MKQLSYYQDSRRERSRWSFRHPVHLVVIYLYLWQPTHASLTSWNTTVQLSLCKKTKGCFFCSGVGRVQCWHLICKWISKAFESVLRATMRVLPVCRSAEFVHSIKAEHNTRVAKFSILHSCNFTDKTVVVWFKMTHMFTFYSSY